MQHLTKEKVLLAFVVASLILYVFMFLITPNIITNVSAVEANGVGVYWDSELSDEVSSIDWGTLEPGSVKNSTVYIRNEGEEPMSLILSTANWTPPKTSEYLNLGWNYTEGRQMNPGEVLQVTLTLSVSRYIEGIWSFSFYILITGSISLLGDLNGDGKVDYSDLFILVSAFDSKPGDPYWNPVADLNNDEKVDYKDLHMLATNYGSK